MALKLFNALGRKWEDFSPLFSPAVGLYTCGPTVYDYPHLGNYRSYIFADILKRTLLLNDYKVKHVMNITDVDDKTIKRSQTDHKSLKDLTEFYTQEFFQDRERLNILPADVYPKASDYIGEMVKLIETLILKDYAYKSEDGSVYFSIKKDDDYGKLAHLNLTTLVDNASGRQKVDEYDKDSAQDFALWKAWHEDDGEVYWETSLGKGRPGWHIECSAMSMKNLGESFDLHTGGVDNLFPHHENEIAQSESATGKQFVKYWLHNEWLLVDGKKMAKSTGNFYTLRDVVDKGYSPLAYRYLVLTAHYRKQLNFTWESLAASQTALNKLENFIRETKGAGNIDQKYADKFKTALNEDLNTPQAVAVMWEVINDPSLDPKDKKATILKLDEALGLKLKEVKSLEIPAPVMQLLTERELARKDGNFSLSDQLRDQVLSLGYIIDDTPTGPKIRQK